jgi:hypothetical protein
MVSPRGGSDKPPRERRCTARCASMQNERTAARDVPPSG